MPSSKTPVGKNNQSDHHPFPHLASSRWGNFDFNKTNTGLTLNPTLASPPAPLQGERGVICCVTTKLPVFINIGMPITPYIIIDAIIKLPKSISICIPIPSCTIIDAITKLPKSISICIPIPSCTIINAITKLPAPINICMPIPACVIFDAITKPPIPISITST